MLEQFFEDTQEQQEIPEIQTQSVIQNRTQIKTRELIGEVEGLFDMYISDWKDKKNYAFLFNIGIKPVHAKSIILFAKKKINEFDSAINSKDSQIIEGYSCFTKSQMKRIVLWWESIIVDCERLVIDSKTISKIIREKNARRKGLDIRKKK